MKKEKETGKTRQPEVLTTLTEPLPVPLTDAEKLLVGLQLAQEEGALVDHEAAVATVKADLKSKEAAIRGRIALYSTQLRNGQRIADVPVDVVAEFPANAAVYVRKDTGKEIRRRALDAAERQGLLLPQEDGAPPLPPELPSGVTRDEDLDD